jgi:hypothetical protein
MVIIFYGNQEGRKLRLKRLPYFHLMAGNRFPIAVLDLEQQAATIEAGIEKFLQAHDSIRFGSRRIMRGEIHRLQPRAIEIVDVLEGKTHLAEQAVIPQATSSRRLSCTSVSMPSMAYSSALSKAVRMFSAASLFAPRWAKVSVPVMLAGLP